MLQILNQSESSQTVILCLATLFLAAFTATICSGCSMSEEVKRIGQAEELERGRTTGIAANLTGEQIFIRSCNTCHPGGNQGVGPSLDKIDQHFPQDMELKTFIRHGSKSMPAQPKETLNEQELEQLVHYLRSINLK